MKNVEKKKETVSGPSDLVYYIMAFGDGETPRGLVNFRTLEGVLAAVAECLARGDHVTVDTAQLSFADGAEVK